MRHINKRHSRSLKDIDSIVKLSNKGIVSSVTNQQNGDLISEIDARLELAERQLDEVKALIVKDVRNLGKEFGLRRAQGPDAGIYGANVLGDAYNER